MSSVYDLAKKYNLGITKEIVSNLASVFFSDAIFELPYETKKAVISIYKTLNFDYVEAKGLLLYRGPFKSFFVKGKAKEPWKITPYRLSPESLECIENILNTPGNGNVRRLSPIFDSLGFILKEENGRFVLQFVGSANYEIWKEIDPKWTEGMDMEEVNWKDGEWADGIDLNNTKFNWKPEENIYGET